MYNNLYLGFFAFAVMGLAFFTKKEAIQMPVEISYEEAFGGIQDYTIELANAMPGDLYTYKPHDSVRSFGEQMAHIAMSSTFLLDVFINDAPMPSAEQFAAAAKMEKEIGQDKEKVIAMLNDMFDYIHGQYDNMTEAQLSETFTVPFDPNSPQFEKRRAFNLVKEHLVHHRGQALVSLRMQGIEAPPFRLY